MVLFVSEYYRNYLFFLNCWQPTPLFYSKKTGTLAELVFLIRQSIPSETKTLNDILVDQLGVRIINGQRNFRNVKTLIRVGYQPNKLKLYRGGMRSWVSLGLTTVNH